MIFNTTISAIQNVFKTQSAIAENIANLNTKDYKEKDINQALYRKTNNSNQRNSVDLSKQIVYSNLNLISLEANVSVLKSQNKMLGSLLDINI